jgi:hypothetical protein
MEKAERRRNYARHIKAEDTRIGFAQARMN